MYINNNFISKLETVNYYIGSFDANIELSKKLIMANSNISRKEADDILENMPTSYRASIMNKNNEYIGYIGIYDIDYKNSVASIRFEVNKKLLDILNYTSMNYYGHVPYSAKNFDKIESSLMFQHIPNMKNNLE